MGVLQNNGMAASREEYLKGRVRREARLTAVRIPVSRLPRPFEGVRRRGGAEDTGSLVEIRATPVQAQGTENNEE